MAQRNNTYHSLDTHKIIVSGGIITFLVLFFLSIAFVDNNEHTAHRQIYIYTSPGLD